MLPTVFIDGVGGRWSPYFSIDRFKYRRLQQSNFSADFGSAGGSIVNMITQSGTNKFHHVVEIVEPVVGIENCIAKEVVSTRQGGLKITF